MDSRNVTTIATDARGRPKASIRLADGRLIWGRSPGLLNNSSQDRAELHDRHRGIPASEAIAEYRRSDQLAEQLGGIIEGWVPAGRADVVTPAAVFEVERWRSWELGLHQVIRYAAQIGPPPALAVFGAVPQESMLKVFNRIRTIRLYGLRQADSIQLWWWNGTMWERIVTSEQCRDIPDGIRFGKCETCGRPIGWFEEDVCVHFRSITREWSIHCKPLLARGRIRAEVSAHTA
jgi:hypothetical protein